MLVLSRKVGESVLIGERIRVTVVAVHGNQVRLGFAAPNDVQILRQELMQDSASRPSHDACVVVS